MDVNRVSAYISVLLEELAKNLCLNTHPFPELSRDAERDAASPPLVIVTAMRPAVCLSPGK
jgi:hypothetical protein